MSEKDPIIVILTSDQVKEIAKKIGIEVTEVHIFPDKVMLKRRYDDVNFRDSPEALEARKHDYLNDLIVNGPNPGPVIGWS